MLPSKSCSAFLAVAELGSFEAAALRLCISASAVTLRVQALEKQLGQILLLRERPCRVTASGWQLFQHLQQQRLREQQLLQQLSGKTNVHQFQELHIATNADSLATWLLKVLQPTLIQQHIALKLRLDDQSQTHQLLESGLVNACISTEAVAMSGCIASYLGAMQYKMVASPAFMQRYFHNSITRDRLKHIPAVIFNDKDYLHQQVIFNLFGLQQNQYPHHFIPSSTAFVDAIQLGLGFGLVPQYQITTALAQGDLVEVIPQAQQQLHLYWHHWKQQPTALQALTDHLVAHAQNVMNGS